MIEDLKTDTPAAETTISTEVEERQVEERVAIGAHVVYETIRREGEEELRRPAAALAWSGLAAGLSMGFSFIAEALLESRLPPQPWALLISRLGYCVGFLIVVLGRQQLFTENTLTVILPLLLNRKMSVMLSVLRLWSVVLAANLAGTFLFAFCVAHVAIFDSSVQHALTQIGAAHLGISFGSVLIRGIFAGWLIALMVWLLPAAENARVSIIIILTYLIGLGGFSHVVAGSTTVLYLVAIKYISWQTYVLGFFVPAFLGNVIGGVSLVAALGHAQVLGGKAT
jgi:formate-nitrite transporter family protein